MDTIELTQETIDNLFKDATNQGDVLIALYKIAFPDWDNIRKLSGWPSISNKTSDYLFKKFIEFDRKYHPDVIGGGCWLNSGFSVEKNLDDWKIYPIDPTKIFYKGEKNTLKTVYIWLYQDNEGYYHARVQFIRRVQLNNDRTESYWIKSRSDWKLNYLIALATEIKRGDDYTDYRIILA